VLSSELLYFNFTDQNDVDMESLMPNSRFISGLSSVWLLLSLGY